MESPIKINYISPVFILKYIISIFLIFVLSIQANSQKINEFKIQVKQIKNKTCYLGYFISNKKFIPIDTATSNKKGKIVFQKKTGYDQGLYVLEFDHHYIDFLIAEPGFQLNTDTVDPIMHMNVSNSIENELYFNYKKFILIKRRKIDSLKLLLNNYPNEIIKKEIGQLNQCVFDYRLKLFNQNPANLATKIIRASLDIKPDKTSSLIEVDSLYTINHIFDNIDFSDQRLIRTPYYYNKLDKFISLIITTPIDSINKVCSRLIEKSESNKYFFIFTLEYLFHYFEKCDLYGADIVYTYLAEKYYLSGKTYWSDSTYVNSLKKDIDKLKPLLTGKKSPPIIMKDQSGNPISLYDIHSKYTILYFWDSQCSHCVEETPKLHDFYKDRNDIQVYAVTLEQSDIQWKSFIREKQLEDWVNVWDPSSAQEIYMLYNLRTTPAIFILDSDKKIIKKNITVDDLGIFFRYKI